MLKYERHFRQLCTFICTYLHIHIYTVYIQSTLLSGVYLLNSGYKVGIHPGWDASQSQGTGIILFFYDKIFYDPLIILMTSL